MVVEEAAGRLVSSVVWILDDMRARPNVVNRIFGDVTSTSTPCGKRDARYAAEPVRLDMSHWLEVLDERHRYGTALMEYYRAYCVFVGSEYAAGPCGGFFQFLDGPGKDLDLSQHEHCTKCRYKYRGGAARPHHRHQKPAAPPPHKDDASPLHQVLEQFARTCPWEDNPKPKKKRRKPAVSRKQLEESRLQYCDEAQRRQYVAVVRDGKLVWANDGEKWRAGDAVHSGTVSKYIFVMDLDGTLYVNKKVKGRFHHSCFLAGGPVCAAGRIVVLDGVVTLLAPYSGHYKPSPLCIAVVLRALQEAGLPTDAIAQEGVPCD